MKLFKWIGEWWTEKKRLRAALAAAEVVRQRQTSELIAQRDEQVAIVQRQLAETDAKLVAREEEWEAELDRLSSELGKLHKAKRPHVIKVAERAMKEEDLAGELAVDDENPMWRAVHQLLDREIAAQVDVVATIAGEKRIEAAGGIAALMGFQATLLDYQKMGKAAEAKEEAEVATE